MVNKFPFWHINYYTADCRMHGRYNMLFLHKKVQQLHLVVAVMKWMTVLHHGAIAGYLTDSFRRTLKLLFNRNKVSGVFVLLIS